jgi:signal transduction histidine kinase
MKRQSLFKGFKKSYLRLFQRKTRSKELPSKGNPFTNLAAIMAWLEHELRNPLAVMNAEIASMRRRFQANSEVLTALERVEKQIRRIFALSEILEIVADKSAFFERDMKEVSIGDVLRHSINALRQEIGTRKFVFKIEEDAIVSTKIHFHLITLAVRSILKHFVHEIRYVKPEMAIITIRVTSENSHRAVIRIDITANGCRIPIYNDIELFIIERILEIHSGSAQFDDNTYQGSTVSLFLPKSAGSK